ncbi:MAG: nucleoside monophosphate kinase [Nanoarchaeota archaeon]
MKTEIQKEIERLDHAGKGLLQSLVLSDELTVPGEHRKIKLLGAPGEGKGTLAKNVTPILRFGVMEGSGLIRRHLGSLPADQRREVEAALSGNGKSTLAPDDVVLGFFDKEYGLIQAELRGDGAKIKGHLYDGLPRNGYQAQQLLKRGLKFDAVAHLQSDPYTPLIRQKQRAVEDLLETGKHRPDALKAENRLMEYENNLPGLLGVLPNMTDRFFVLLTDDAPLVTAYNFFVKASPQGDGLKPKHVESVSDQLRDIDKKRDDLSIKNLMENSSHYAKVRSQVEDFQGQIRTIEAQRQQYFVEACRASHH